MTTRAQDKYAGGLSSIFDGIGKTIKDAAQRAQVG
jgi:hypothetical protein